MMKMENDFRENLPEGKVVEALKGWIDAQCLPIKCREEYWQSVLKALRTLEEVRMQRLEQAQILYDLRFGEKTDNVAEIKEDSELNKIYSGKDS